jgi:hypothetical protein
VYPNRASSALWAVQLARLTVFVLKAVDLYREGAKA